MTSYTVTLQNEEDFNLLKKIIKSIEGATITPMKQKRSHLDTSIEEAEKGEISGPFDSVQSLMKDLLD